MTDPASPLGRLQSKARSAVRIGAFDLTTSAGLVMVLGFAQNLVLARILGPAGLGHVSVVNATMGFANLVAALGITVAILRHGAAQEGEAEGWAVFRSGLGFALASSAVVTVVLAGLARSPLWVFDPEAGLWLPVAALAIPAAVLTLAGGKYLQARRRMREKAVLDFVARALVVGCVLAGSALYGFPGFVVGYVGGALLGALVSATRVFSTRPRERVESPVPRSEMLRFGIWSVFTGFMNHVLTSADLLCVSAILEDPVQTGLYGLAVVLLRSVRIPSSAYLDAMFPRLVRHASDPATFTARRHAMQRNLLLIAGGTCFAAAAGAPLLVAPIFGEAYRASVAPFWILAGAQIFWALGAVQGRSLLAHNWVQGNFAASAFAAIVNVAANLLLIPRFGIEGAAMATAGTQILWSGLVTWMCRRVERERARPVDPAGSD